MFRMMFVSDQAIKRAHPQRLALGHDPHYVMTTTFIRCETKKTLWIATQLLK